MKKILFSLLILILCSLPKVYAYAQSPSELTLSEAIQTALQNNPSYQAAVAQLEVSEAQLLSAKSSYPNPSIVTDNAPPEKTYRIGIEQTILLGGDRRKRIAVATAQQDVLRAEIQTTALQLRASVRQAYTRLYTAQECYKVYEQLLALAQTLLNVAEKREKAGDIALVDVLQVRLLMLDAKNDWQAAQYDLTQARNELNTLLNQPLDNTITLAPPLHRCTFMNLLSLLHPSLHRSLHPTLGSPMLNRPMPWRRLSLSS
ncbi:MAG: TolC family protein [Vampirovibrionales bacterium]